MTVIARSPLASIVLTEALWLKLKHVTIGEPMDIAPDKQREFYEIVFNSLAGMEDDLLASEVPMEAVEHVRQALRICNSDFKRRFEFNVGGVA